MMALEKIKRNKEMLPPSFRSKAATATTAQTGVVLAAERSEGRNHSDWSNQSKQRRGGTSKHEDGLPTNPSL